MAKQISRRIESGIARVERPGRLPVYRVQLSGQQVGGRRLNRDCPTYAEAQAVKRTWLETGGAELHAGGPDQPAPTVEDGLRAYVADLQARQKGHQRAAQVLTALRRFAPSLPACPVAQVAPGALYAFRQAREQGGIKANTIIRDLRVLRAMFRLMGVRDVVPADVFPPENLTRVRVLQPAEEARVFPLLREPFRTIARLAALTLMRQGDLRTLARDMVHLEQGLILLPKTKTVPRAVVLGDEAVALLAKAIAQKLPASVAPESRYVFPSPTGKPYTRWYVSKQWRLAARAAGLSHFTFHDLKHHGATVALNAGASDRVLMALGGWTRPDQINRYGFAVEGTLRALANRIAKGLGHEP